MRTKKLRKSYANLKRTEIERELKAFGNRSRSKNPRKSYAYIKITEIVRVQKTIGN